MGIFDTIRCYWSMPIPNNATCDVNFNSITYQTKSLDKLMENFKITSDGILEKEKGSTVLSSKHGSNGYFEKWKETCTIEFYAIHEGYWIEYLAIFDRGEIRQMDLKEYKEIEKIEGEIDGSQLGVIR